MSRVTNATFIYALALLLVASVAARSQQGAYFTAGELDELLAPIALYPDPLLAQILPAATYPDQLDAASNLVSYQGLSALDYQPWDVSVKSVAHYPSVLKLMVDGPDWTAAVGQAYVNQPDDVMRSIQRLRAKARLMGYLNSNSYQTVGVSGGYISIVPAQAQYVYVPTYNPQVVYVQRRPNYAQNALWFGAGLLIGAWLNNSIDWNRNRVYYHGWNGGGWVGRARPHVQYNNRYYDRPFRVNRNVRSRDLSGYRSELRRGVGTYRPPGVVVPGVSTTRPGTRPGGVTRPGTARPGTRPGAGVVPTTPGTRPTRPGTMPTRPRERPSTVAPAPRPGAGPTTTSPRPGTGVTRPSPTAGPNAPVARPRTRPGTGVTRPNPATVPNAPVARPRSVPRSGTGVTTPSPGVRSGQPRPTTRPQAGVTRPQARPSAPGVRSAPKGSSGTIRQAPATGGSKAVPRPRGRAGAGKGDQTNERK